MLWGFLRLVNDPPQRSTVGTQWLWGGRTHQDLWRQKHRLCGTKPSPRRSADSWKHLEDFKHKAGNGKTDSERNSDASLSTWNQINGPFNQDGLKPTGGQLGLNWKWTVQAYLQQTMLEWKTCYWGVRPKEKFKPGLSDPQISWVCAAFRWFKACFYPRRFYTSTWNMQTSKTRLQARFWQKLLEMW